MERLKTFRYIVWMAAVLLLVQLVMFVAVMFPLTTFLWLFVGVMAVLVLYLVRISLVLIGELEKKERDDGGK